MNIRVHVLVSGKVQGVFFRSSSWIFEYAYRECLWKNVFFKICETDDRNRHHKFYSA